MKSRKKRLFRTTFEDQLDIPEAIATEQRSLLRVRSFEPLAADTLAAKLGATLFTPDQVPNLEPEQVAVLLASDGWSGAIS